MKLLIIEDEKDIVKPLKKFLKGHGFAVDTAFDGEEGLKLARVNDYDCVFLDLNLPKLDGIMLSKEMRQASVTPIIMVTALSEYGDIERGIDSGTDDFISKPVNKLELVTRVKTMLKLKHLTDKLERTLAYLDQIEKQAQKMK